MRLARFYLLFILCTCLAVVANGQKTFDLPLTVLDKYERTPLPGVAVWVNDSLLGATDIDGYFMLREVSYLDSVKVRLIGFGELHLRVLDIRKNRNQLFLDSQTNLFDAVVVIGRRDEKKEDIPQLISSTSQEAIQKLGAQTAADALEMNNQAFVQRSQMGGGSPILRGFEANKVLLVVDGIRMNNAIYRSGHLQNSITVDPIMLDQIEVIYGPGSLIYGSDALGGVIHYRTQQPLLYLAANKRRPVELRQRAMLRYHSANNGKLAHYDVNIGTKKWAFVSSLSLADFDDMLSGSKRPDKYPDFGKRPSYVLTQNGIDQVVNNPNPNRQVGTGYTQVDAMQKVLFRPDEKAEFLLNIQYSNSSNIPRYDQLIEPGGDENSLRFAEWYYGPQQRLLSALKFRSLHKNLLYDKAYVIASYQRISEDRHRRRFGRSERTYTLQTVDVYSITADFDKRLNPTSSKRLHSLAYGMEYNHNDVLSTAGGVNVRTGAVSTENLPTRYPSGGSEMALFGAYAAYGFRSANERFSLNAGLRLSQAQSTARFREEDPIQWPGAISSGVSNQNTALTWSVGGRWRSKQNFEIRILAASAFRAPNIDDFGKVRPNSGNVIIPNLGLQPENAVSTEITIGKYWPNKSKQEQANVSITAFHTWLTDAIVRTDASLDGDTLLLFDDDFQRIQTNINAAEARIYGLSAQCGFPFAGRWHFRAAASYTYGRQQLDGEETPLAHIPPLYGLSSLAYSFDKWQLRAVWRFNAAKPLSEFAPSSSDNDDLATPEGSLAWNILNMYATYELSPISRIHAGLENILDLHYRTFSSGISAPGRSMFLSWVVSW